MLIGLEFQSAGENNNKFKESEAKKKNPREIRLVIMKNRNYKAWEEVDYNYYPMFNYYEEDNARGFTDSQYRAIKESIKQKL